MTMRGIDVSYANGPIDWAKVKKSKLVDFAIIRSTFGSDLPSQIDSYFFLTLPILSTATKRLKRQNLP